MGIDIEFVRHGDLQIACTVPEGRGPNFLWTCDWWTPTEVIDQLPPMRDLFGRLGSFCRWATFDPPGTGSSDVISLDPAPGLDFWVDVVTSVMNGLGWGQAVLCGPTMSAAVAIAFAARHPERVSHLVLPNPFIGNDADASSKDRRPRRGARRSR